MQPHQLWVPIAALVCLTFCISLFLVLTFRDRRERNELVRQAIQLGQSLDRETLALLLGAQADARTELRAALSSIGLGLGFVIAGGFMLLGGIDDYTAIFTAAVGVVILGRGLGRLAAFRWLNRQDR